MNIFLQNDTLSGLVIHNQSTEMDIQPILSTNAIFQYFFIVSIVLLGIIGAIRLLSRTQVFESLPQFFFSEPYSYSRFLTQPFHRLLAICIIVFVAIQLSFIVAEPSLVSLFVFTGGLVLFFLVRLAFYSTLQYLHFKQINIKYYLSTYLFYLLFFGLILFSIHCFQQATAVQISDFVLLIGIILFILLLGIRWVFISIRYQVISSVYFFLYFCTLEIVPILILTKHML